VGSPEGFTASLRVEDGEWVTAELWASFGGQQHSEERVRAPRSELATSSLRPLFWRESERNERMDASTAFEASPWRSCVRLELTSRARDDVRAPNIADVLSPVGHVDELDSDSDNVMHD